MDTVNIKSIASTKDCFKGQALNILERFRSLIVGTDLIQVPSRFAEGGQVFAKLENQNYGETIKARAVYAMMAKVVAEKTEAELRNTHILEYTGGTLGVCLAMLCQQLGIKLTLVLLDKTADSLTQQMVNCGANIIKVPAKAGFYQVMETAKALSADPKYTFLYQHENLANQAFHKKQTSVEIIQQLEAKGIKNLKAWCASIGTAGTLMGVGLGLKERWSSCEIYGVTPSELPYGSYSEPNGLPKYLGSGGIGYGIKQRFVRENEHMVKGHFHYSFKQSIDAVKQIYALTGLKVGSSSGANWLAATLLARGLKEHECVVTIFPSGTNSSEWPKVIGSSSTHGETG
ncbi:pyridoxal-phosphate dependent enzyme [Zooshikella marina]|uniref:cysteine synthase n=1 Tax=Zooshikella ganghwensis TaxID=202772 RepID=A0A4P9VKV3_9GAMM|nr:pyridoxal-phosphate dependent enzyme [Zooshikella ganghwensis]MBU2706696.1 pyridoxal-phosphate dependent enzyme [Zooshikella ganghwensis]RDH43945.1 pyridoxal-phosphate dependent enzyme [Zooshikella ganghwensis]